MLLTIPCECGRSVEVPEATLLSELGRVLVRRRKVHKGATPKQFPCRWCAASCTGRVALEAHERACDRKPDGALVEVTAADLAEMGWSPSE